MFTHVRTNDGKNGDTKMVKLVPVIYSTFNTE